MFNNIVFAICRDEFGLNAIMGDATVVGWAANEAAKVHGTEAAARALNEVNDRRAALGGYTSLDGLTISLKAACLALRSK